jgi:hypothetical protein
MEDHPMKLVTLALIAAFAATAAAQNSSRSEEIPAPLSPGVNSQTGCPVNFTDVALKTNATFMLVKQDAEPNGSLTFQYKNQSGKQIQSISIRVDLAAKRSVYDLDAVTITRDMTLTRDSEETLPLPANVFVYSLGRVTLEQVNFVGGTVWTPKATNTCSYEKAGSAEAIAK